MIIKNASMENNVAKSFDILAINLSVLYNNYFDVPVKLF